MISVHDNEITSYLVDLKNHKIVLNTETSNNSDQVEISFVEVLAHKFVTQIEGSIILDIQENGLNLFFKENKELLENQKNYGWPLHYESIDDLSNRLMKEGYLYYEILSSYGLNGWVVAKKINIITNN